jgi:hypothetical protein
MNYKELAQQYGVVPPEEKKLYCTKCGSPKHGGECATSVGPPLWFDEADTKPAAAPSSLSRHKSPLRGIIVIGLAAASIFGLGILGAIIGQKQSRPPLRQSGSGRYSAR